MDSILNEISLLRSGIPIKIDYINSNRYRLVTQENDGSKTAYYFSVPIYNDKTKKLLDLQFKEKSNKTYYTGSNANIVFDNNVLIESDGCICDIKLGSKISMINTSYLLCGQNHIYPTTNGFVYKVNCSKEKKFSFEVDISPQFASIRSNNKYISILNEKNKSLITISCIGATDANNKIISPVEIEYKAISNTKLFITIFTHSPFAIWCLLEINAYEQKFIQDTTVESKNSQSNNAFGGIAFLGNTQSFGEQWLYSRPDFSKMPELIDVNINKVLLHLPQYNNTNTKLEAHQIATRFCSFGSKWINKIPPIGNSSVDSYITAKHQTFDITNMITDKFKRLKTFDGIIIKSKDNGCVVVSTGDNYYLPQIYEINFK